MACGSGCCGPSAAAAAEETSAESAPVIQAPRQEDEDSCGGDVSSVVDRDPDQPRFAGLARDELAEMDDKSRLIVSTPGQGARCDKLTVGPQDGAGCEVRNVGLEHDTEPSCSKGCCSAPEPPRSDDTGVPSCCEGKAAPCCDQSCLDRLALRECEIPQPALSESHGTAGSQSVSSCGRGKDGRPCANHARKIRTMYAEKLEALGCICRTLIALGQESCCKPQRRSSTRRGRRPCEDIVSHSRASVGLCCVTDVADSTSCFTKTQSGSQKGCRSADDGRVKHEAPSIVSVEELTEVLADAAHATDLEKGFSSHNDKEHVILSISGMTCTGCETKLLRSLGLHPSVKNLKTSLVLARAEFDLVGAASVVEVMKHLERTTEFKCETVTNRGSSLDIIAYSGDAAAFANQPWPDGVTDLSIVDKKTVNVSFNAEIIGARDLVECGWGDGPVRLAAPRPDPTLEAGSRHVRHVGYMTLLSACLTIPVLVIAWAPLPERHLSYDLASLALATLVQFVVAGPFYPKALKALVFSRVVEMDLLVVLSTSAAYIFSVISLGYAVSGQPLSTGEFFETSTLLVTLIMVGRWVGALARQKAVKSISIRSLQTPSAIVVTDNGEREIDARLLQYGDVFKVVPDSRIPTDGTVVSGTSEVNESMITGESRPVEKYAGSPVIAGSVNGPGTLHARLTRLPGDNTISTIAGMVDEAKLSKPKIQDIADRVASYFVPVVVAITIITFCIWIAIGVKVRGQPGSEATVQAITYAITLLIVSCPCAIGLAVPMVIVIATGVAAERGVIFKSAEGFAVAYRTSHVVFDKTGTITQGKLMVAQEWYADSDQNATQSLLLGLVGGVKHPVSAAVAARLKIRGVSPTSVSDVKTVVGKGVQGTAKGSGLTLRAGNSRWLNLTSNPVVQSALSQGYTVFCFMIGCSVAAIFGLEDSIRSDAASTVRTLLGRGISVHIISGDDEGAVRSVAAQLGIAETNMHSRCTPAEKQAYVQGLLEGSASPNHASKNKKPKTPVVIFCGDGTNDAVALAQATIGVHMNEGGTDVAESAADVILMCPNLAGILTTIAVSRNSIRRIAFNFGWSFVYNLFAILLAAGTFVKARIPPEFAGLGELISVLPVIAVATLLRWSKI